MRKYHIFLMMSCGLLITCPMIIDLSLNKEKYFSSKPEEPGIREMGVFVINEVTSLKWRLKSRYGNEFIFSDLGFKLYRDLNYSFFGREPLPQKVVKGKNGWLFLGNGMSNVIYETTGVSNFNPAEISGIKRDQIKRAKELEKKNISYYITIAPNKHTIYREQLDIPQDSKKTRLVQVADAFNEGDINYIDLSGIKDFKDDLEIYYKQDTHWNDYGAFFAYTKIITSIKEKFPQIVPLGMDELETKWSSEKEMDLYRILKRDAHIFNKRLVVKDKKSIKKEALLVVPENNKYTYELRFENPEKDLKILVFRDSFTSDMVPFISENFGEAVFIWSSYDEKIVEIEKPDVVLIEMVERYIERLLN